MSKFKISHLVDDSREEEVEEHGGGADPARPPEGVVGVEGDGEGDDDEVGQDVAVGVAHQVDVGRHPLVGIVEPAPLRHVQLVVVDAAEVDLVQVEGQAPVTRRSLIQSIFRFEKTSQFSSPREFIRLRFEWVTFDLQDQFILIQDLKKGLIIFIS